MGNTFKSGIYSVSLRGDTLFFLINGFQQARRPKSNYDDYKKSRNFLKVLIENSDIAIPSDFYAVQDLAKRVLYPLTTVINEA